MLVLILVVGAVAAAGIAGLYFYVKHRNGVEPLTADEVDLLQRQDEFLIPNRGKFTGLKSANADGTEVNVKDEDEDQNVKDQDQESDSSEDIQCGCGCGGKWGCCNQQ